MGTIGSRLKSLRKYYDFTLSHVSNETGLSCERISYLEEEDEDLLVSELITFAGLYKIPIQCLLFPSLKEAQQDSFSEWKEWMDIVDNISKEDRKMLREFSGFLLHKQDW